MSLTQRMKEGNVPMQYRLSMPFDSRFDIIPGNSILSEVRETISRFGIEYSLRSHLPLGNFGVPHAGQFGFGNAVYRFESMDDYTVWALTIPSITLYQHDHEGFERNLLCISATLQVIFSGLNMSYKNIQEEDIQLLSIEGITTKPNKKDFSFRLLLFKAFFDWLAVIQKDVSQKCEQKISDTMDEVHKRLAGKPSYPYRELFKLYSGSQCISLPRTRGDSDFSVRGNCPTIDAETGCMTLFYTLHSPIEQLTFLSGIAVLYDFVYSHTTQKEKSE